MGRLRDWKDRRDIKREQKKIYAAIMTIREARLKASKESGKPPKRDHGERRGSLKDWHTSTMSRTAAESAKVNILERARDLIVNDPTAAGLGKLSEEVVNIGITPQPSPMTKFLNRDDTWESEYQSTIMNYFHLWGLSPQNFCDATGRQNIYMLQQLAFFAWKFDGIGIFQRIYNTAPGRPLSNCWLPIDSYRLKTPYRASRDKDIYDGLELDKNGFPVKAYILKDTAKQATDDNLLIVDVIDKSTGLPNLLLVCDVRFISEYRQDSILGPVIKTLRDKGDTTSAALIKTLMHNMWIGAAEPPEGAGYGAAFYKALQALEFEDRIRFLDEGTLLQLLPGEKMNWLDSQAPGPNFKSMIETANEEIGMATGRGYEHTTRRYQSSYSASRAAMLMANMLSESDRMVLNNRFNDPWMSWLQLELSASGKTQISWSEVLRLISEGALSALTNTDWLPPPHDQIDPLKSAKAEAVKMENGLETLAGYWGRHSKDWKAQMRQQFIEKRERLSLEEEFEFTLDNSDKKQDVYQDEPEQEERNNEENQRTSEE